MKQLISALNPKQHSEFVFQVLSAVFISSLIIANLTLNKFFSIDLGFVTFTQSVGILPYPITFIVTDIVSEIYGRRKANQLVWSGIIASLFMLIVISIADSTKAIEGSQVTDQMFHTVFGFAIAAVSSSMIAYSIAQFIDVRLFHFWKKKTKGKHLWLRNNASTITSQCLDTFTVLAVLCYFGVIPWNLFGMLFLNGFLFKIFFAAFDTPIIYICCNYLRTKYGLEFGQTLSSKNKT